MCGLRVRRPCRVNARTNAPVGRTCLRRPSSRKGRRQHRGRCRRCRRGRCGVRWHVWRRRVGVRVGRVVELGRRRRCPRFTCAREAGRREAGGAPGVLDDPTTSASYATPSSERLATGDMVPIWEVFTSSAPRTWPAIVLLTGSERAEVGDSAWLGPVAHERRHWLRRCWHWLASLLRQAELAHLAAGGARLAVVGCEQRASQQAPAGSHAQAAAGAG